MFVLRSLVVDHQRHNRSEHGAPVNQSRQSFSRLFGKTNGPAKEPSRGLNERHALARVAYLNRGIAAYGVLFSPALAYKQVDGSRWEPLLHFCIMNSGAERYRQPRTDGRYPTRPQNRLDITFKNKTARFS